MFVQISAIDRLFMLIKILRSVLPGLLFLSASAIAKTSIDQPDTHVFWKSANIYFMLTDRFNNGDPENDLSYARKKDADVLRGFEGGDIKGIIQKIESGYFNRLGIDAIWMSPLIEQVHGFDESWGRSYAFHGYWPKDWTSIDANFGNEDDLKNLIATAHRHNIRILLDVIINHTGPKTEVDPLWPTDWIRTGPDCQWHNQEHNVQCTLASSLPDILTEKETDVALPALLINKWKNEGRLDQEMAELDAFFKRTGYPRAPKYYIVKWLTDWVREYGVDGFRVDTAKHVEPEIWSVLKKESQYAFNLWKQSNPKDVLDDLPFYMVGEVMHFGVDGFKNTVKGGRAYDYSDAQVDFFNYGFDALINMGFAAHAHLDEEALFSLYSKSLNHGELKSVGILNYIGSHDDHDSYDRDRKSVESAAFKLMMAPGAAQIYYGDELARPMRAKGAKGDAHMRVFMNWQDLKQKKTQSLLKHWQKLGQFRQAHRAVGAGTHTQLSASPYIFKRELGADSISDKVIVAKKLPIGTKIIETYGVFKNNEKVRDYYSGQITTVQNGKVTFTTPFEYLLLGLP